MSDTVITTIAAASASVLVVEDEFLVALDVEAILSRNGHAVLGPVGSVSKALELLERERPGVAILDINLRGEMIYPVAERLKELGVPFVLSSAYNSNEFDKGGVLAEADNIGKPFMEDRLMEALVNALRTA
jgi:two-component SAPR family response regulator